MKTDKRISDAMESLLQEQIKKEMSSSNIYLHFGNWCNLQGYFYAEKFFKKHAEEERSHMNAMIDYLLDRNCMPKTPDLEAVTNDFYSLVSVMERSYEHEKVITESLCAIFDKSVTEKDYVTQEFIGKYVNEQREEEALFNDIITTLQLAEGNMAAILMIEAKL